MNQHQRLLDLRSTVAGLLALTVKKLFPKVLWMNGRGTAKGFFYDFLFPYPFQKEFLLQIEEAMQAQIRRKLPVEVKEMVPMSAKGYFLARKEPFLAQNVGGISKSLVSLLMIGQEMIFSGSEGSLCQLGEIGGLKLQGEEILGEVRGKTLVRIHGSAFFDKQALKEWMKQEKNAPRLSHQALVAKNAMCRQGKEEWIWLPKGKILLDHWMSWMSHQLQGSWISSSLLYEGDRKKIFNAHEEVFEASVNGGALRVHEFITCLSSEDKDLSLGLLDLPLYRQHVCHVFCKTEDLLREVISSLHFVGKILKILGFDFRLILKEGGKAPCFGQALHALNVEYEAKKGGGIPMVEWLVQDALGREWPLMQLVGPRKAQREGYSCFFQSLCLSVERLVALLIEKYQGKLPLWISPEQLRVFFSPKEQERAGDLLRTLEKKGIRASSRELKSFKEQVHCAREEGIPYIAVIEEVETAIVLRSLRGEEQKSSLSWQGLVEMLEENITRSYCSEL